MAINFPNSPSTNDTHSHNGLSYIYDGTIWKLQTLDTTTSNEIIPYAYAHVRANTAGTGTNMSWGAYNSSNGDMAFTFDTALSDNLYYVLSEREQYDTHTVSIIYKTTAGFTARWLDNSGTQPLAPDIFPGVLIVYASDPTKSIGGVGGGGDRDRIIESDTSVECIDDGTGDRIVFKTAATEAVQIDANRQILISGTQSGNNVAKIYNDTDGLGTGVLGVYASSNNATPRDVRFYSGGGTANEIFRIGKDGQIGVGGDVGTAGEVLTSGGPSGAATWSAASGGSGPTTEEIQDIVGAMFSGNTETRIAATYEDSDGTIDLVVSEQDVFKNIAVSGQSNVVADSSSDTLTLVAGTNVTLTTDANTDSITINATGGGDAVGTIVAWSGSTSNIPSEYQLCDGATPVTTALQLIVGVGNVVPDLTDRFIVGTGGNFANKTFAGTYGVATAHPYYYSLFYIIKHTATSGSGGGSGLQNIVEDLTPQLGGKLDTNTHNIDFTDDSAAYFGGFSSSYGSGLSIHHDPNNVNGNVSFIDDRSYNGLNIMYGTSTDSFGNYVSKVLFKQRSGNGIPAYDLKVWNSGVQPRNILDKDTQAGTAGQVLSATGLGGLDGLDWIDLPSSGIPIVNVKDFGAVPGAGGATNRTGIQNAIDSLASTGGLIYIPTGSYAITGTINIDQGVMGDGGGISIIGPTQNYRITAADAEGACLVSTDTTSDIFRVSNVRNVTFANLSFDHTDGAPRTDGAAVHFYSNVNTQQIRMDRIYIRKQFGGIKVDGHSIGTFRDIEIRDLPLHPGCYGMLFSASAGGSERVDQVRCENVIIDGLVDGGPHPEANGLWVKDFVNSIWFLNCAVLRCNKGFLMDSTVPSGATGNPGSFFRINDCDFDTNLDVGIEIAGGSFIWINNPYISSNKKNGLRTTSTFTGVLRINDADCRGNWEHGILIGSDMHKKIFITNPQVCYNSANSSGTYDGIHIVDSGSLNQSDITIMGGQCGGSDMMGTTDGSNTTNSTPQNWGIKFSNNSKYDRISISNIDCSNNRAGGVYFSYNKGQHNYIHNVIGVHAGNQGH